MFWIFKKRFNFYKMLYDQTVKSHKTLEALLAFMDDPTEQNGQKVRLSEKEADSMRTQLAQALNASFVTPLDREDIFGLSRAIDDMADYAKTTIEEMTLFEVSPNPHLREMTVALEKGADLLCEAVSLLGDHAKRNAAIGDLLIKVKKTENFVEKIYRQALRELFKSSDVISILKTREIYRHLSNAADRMDQAADIMGDMMIKVG